MSEGLYSMEAKDFDKTLDLTKIKPYGDTMNDGKVQMSFTLPVPCGAEAVEAAKLMMKKWDSKTQASFIIKNSHQDSHSSTATAAANIQWITQTSTFLKLKAT